MPELIRDVLDVTRVRQEKPLSYCGPACAQMIIKRYGNDVSQDDIWNATRPLMTTRDVWNTDPDAMSAYLRLRPEVAQNVTANDLLYTATAYEDAISKIVRSVDHYRFPPIMLTTNGGHWVVVAGVVAGFSDAAHEHGVVASLVIANPGRGETNLDPMGRKTLPLNRLFKRTFSPVGDWGGDWAGSRVIIAEHSDDDVDALSIIGESRPIGGGGIPGAEDVPGLVIEDFAHYGLGDANKILGGGAVDPAPQKVNVVGSDDYYYLTPIDYQGRLVWAVFVPQLDGVLYNNLGEVWFTENLPLPPTDDVLKRRLLSRVKDIRSSPRIVERHGLWWKACMQLNSMFDVVRIVEIDKKELFVRADGTVLASLDDAPVANTLAG